MTHPTEQSAQQSAQQSKTPRTDAVVHNGSCSDAVNKYRELSRQLETSLAAMTAECERLREEIESVKNDFDAAIKEKK